MDENELIRKKRYLKRYKKNNALIDRLENKLVDLDARIYKIKSPNYSGMPRGGTPVTLEDLLSEKLETEERINRLSVKSKKLRRETIEKIDESDNPRHAEILELFFVQCMSFDMIAEKTGYTTRHVIRLYTEAINNLDF